MVINLIILLIISYISYKICNKSFLEKEGLKGINKITIIIFQMSFILSNLIITFIILFIILPVNDYDLLLWKLFLIFFAFFFFYFLPFYLIYNLYDHSNKKGLYKIISIYSCYLISSNIIYRFLNRSYEKSIFKFDFYFNYLNILEYLAFIGDIFNGINCAYNHVTNISSLLIYPILKNRKFLNNSTDLSIKKNLEEINNQIFAEEAKLNELNLEENKLLKDTENNKKYETNQNLFKKSSKEFSKSRQSVQNKLLKLKSIQISYEFQLDITNQKENKNKQKDIVSIIINIIKIIQGFALLVTGTFRCFLMDYSYFNSPLNLEEKSSIHDLLKTPYIKFIYFSDGFIMFVEQVYSLSIIFIMFSLIIFYIIFLVNLINKVKYHN